MKLEQSFEVQAPLQRVWEALIDVERVAPCLPGAAVTAVAVSVMLFTDRDVAPIFGHLSPLAGPQHR